MRGDLRRLVATLVIVTLALLAANIATRAWLLLRVTPNAHHLRTLSDQLDTLHAGMVDEETALRGYLATGSTLFLPPYVAGQPRIAQAASALASGVHGATLTRDLTAVTAARSAWTGAWANRAIAPAQNGLDLNAETPKERVALIAFLMSGKQLFDTYRNAHDHMDHDISVALDAANHEESLWLLWSGIFQAVLALLLGAITIRAGIRIGHRVTHPLGVITRTVSAIRGGTLAARADVGHAATDFTQLADDVNTMADSLEEQIGAASAHATRLSIVLEVARDVAGAQSPRYVIEHITSAVLRLGNERARVWLVDDDGGLLLAFDSTFGRNRRPAATRVQSGAGMVGRAAHYRQPVGPEPLADDTLCAIALPMSVGGRVVGVLEAIRPTTPGFESGEVEVLSALTSHAAGAITAAQLNEDHRVQARTDALTSLPNRRAFDAEYIAEAERAIRYERPLAVVSVDLDHFKELNDRYGHAYGDLALQQAAEAVLTHVRQSDRAYRIGGEELIVVCPETTAAEAAVLAERLRVAIESSPGPEAPRVTASLGVAELPTDAHDGATLLLAADRALYRAKAGGRNRVFVTSQSDMPPQPGGASGAQRRTSDDSRAVG